MRSRFLIAVVSLATLAIASPVVGAPFVPGTLRKLTRFVVPSGLRVGRCTPCPDGLCAQLAVRRLPRSAARLAHAQRVGRYWLQLDQTLDGSRLVIDAPTGRVRCRVVKRRRSTMVYIGTLHLRRFVSALRRRIRGDKSMLRQTKSHIEKLVLQRRYTLATKRLQALDVDPSKADEVRLWLADLQALRGRLPTAYTQYRLLARSAGWSEPGLEAALRAATLAYAIDGVVPATQLATATAREVGAKGESARLYLSALLIDSGKLALSLSLLCRDGRPENRAEAVRLVEALLRRCRLQSTPRCGALAIYRGEHLLRRAPRGSLVLAKGAEAFLSLGLPSEATTILQRVLRQRPARAVQELALRLLVRAYGDSGQRFRALRTAAYYLSLHRQASVSGAVYVARARLLLLAGRSQHIRGVNKLPIVLAARIKRSLAVRRGRADQLDAPLWRRIEALERVQTLLERTLVRRSAQKSRRRAGKGSGR